MLLALGIDEGAREWRKSLEAGEVKETESPLEPPKETQPCPHLDLRQVKLISDLRPPEQQDNKYV